MYYSKEGRDIPKSRETRIPETDDNIHTVKDYTPKKNDPIQKRRHYETQHFR